ncbi:MAG: carbonic anhydrase family protein [Dehalococcoidia bacterium]
MFEQESQDLVAEATRAGGRRMSRRAFAQRSSSWLVAGGAVALLTGCGASVASKEDVAALRKEIASLKADPAKPEAKAGDAHAAGGAAEDAKHWGYEGEAGPENWAELAPENAVCRAGSSQSPIDFTGTQIGAGGRTNIKWQPAVLSVQNNGHTIQADVTNGGAIDIDGVAFTLVQFHFHAPSEHTVQGKRFAMETHFVHKNAKGEVAVIGVLHETGLANDALAPILAALPANAEEKKQFANFDVASVLPRDRSMYRYTGSLTTPPCTEGVRWQVIQAPTSVAEAQVKAFNTVIKPNARPVQPLKARDVLKESIWKLMSPA